MSSSGSPPTLKLETAIALGPVFGHAPGHQLGRFLGDRAVEDEVVAIAAAQQRANRLAGGFAEDIPASHVDSRLDVGVALRRCVHAAIQPHELPRIFAQKVRPELGDACACTGS